MTEVIIMSKLGRNQFVAIGIGAGVIIAAVAGIAVANKSVDTSSLEQYEVYRGYNDEYKEVCNDYYKESLKSGRADEEACKDAIGKTQVYILDDLQSFSIKYCTDENNNGIADGIDRGEITEDDIIKKFGLS